MSVSGSIRKCTIDGITYDVMADADLSEIGSGIENTALATSGRNMRKMTKRVQSVESVVIACSGAEKERLKALSESREDVPMSYETAAGDVYRSNGFIEFQNRTTQENRATVTLFPRDQWAPFLA